MPLSAGWYYTIHKGGPPTQPPLVLIHGAGSSHLVWPVEVRRLPGFTILAVDLPGHGRSEGVGLHSIKSYTRRLVEFLDAAGYYRVILCGYSMGAAIALQAAALAPERVAALALLCGFPHLALPPDLLDQLRHPISTEHLLNMLAGKLFSPRAPRRLVEQCLKVLSGERLSVMARDWLACSEFQAPNLAFIKQPCWVAAAAEDRLVLPLYPRILARELPNATLKVFPNAGHMLVLEQPAALAAGLEKFLHGVFPPPES